jgi:carbamoyltransferase
VACGACGINDCVKGREFYRPYAPVVLESHAPDWFDIERSPHMLLAARVRVDSPTAIQP